MITAQSAGLASSQFAHAQAIVAAVKARGLPVRAAHIALETAMAESNLWMYANGNNPRSLQLAHDRVGWDHGSVGLFQQQVGGAKNSTANWGTTDELMNVAISTAKFINELGPVTKWQGKSNWMAAQDVQHSAVSDGSNYRARDAQAIQLGNALWGTAPSSSSPVKPIVSVPPPTSTRGLYTVMPGDNLSTIAKKFKTTVANMVALNRAAYPGLASNPNLIQVGWKLRTSTSSASVAPKPTPAKRTYVVQRGDNLTLIAKHYPSAKITAASIAKANGLANPDLIYPGQKLVIA